MEWPKFAGTYRAGQADSVKALVEAFTRKPGALLEAHCGAGKTVMGLAIASHLNTPAIVIVHKDDLASQWHEAAKFFPGLKCGHVQQNQLDYEGCHFVTAMAQTIHRRADKFPPEFFKHFGLAIFDEGHRYPAKTFEPILGMFPAIFRLAVSATWRRKDAVECIWGWHIGSVEHKTKQYRAVGQYRQILWNTPLRDADFTRGGSLNTAKYITAIAEEAAYNEWLTKQLIEGATAGRQMALITERICQIVDIQQRLRILSGIEAGIYAGAVNKKRIKKAELEAAKTCQIILATYGKMSEGTDIPTLDSLIFGTPRTDVEQPIGRIQRPLQKRPLIIVDPIFNTRYNKILGKKREGVYKQLGFTNQLTEGIKQ
jgi:superfamily II DNA or RNA helicase